MNARSLARALGAVVVALGVAAGAAGAQGKGKAQDKGQDKGKGGGQHIVQPAPRAGERDAHPNASRGGTPPGLAKKPGGMPPGQYKKRYRPDDGVVILRDVFGREGIRVVRVERSGDIRYVFYRTRTGTVQRAVVSPGAERPTITGAPKSVMGQVLSRMQ